MSGLNFSKRFPNFVLVTPPPTGLIDLTPFPSFELLRFLEGWQIKDEEQDFSEMMNPGSINAITQFPASMPSLLEKPPKITISR